MAGFRKIPMRPDSKDACKELGEEQMDALSYYVISGCAKEFAFERFVVGGYNISKMALAHQSAQLWGSRQACEYIEAYKKTLTGFFKKRRDKSADADGPPDDESRTEGSPEDGIRRRKTRAVRQIIEYILEEASHIQDLEDPETLVKIADKVGLFDDYEKGAEAPRRYLPIDKCGDCRYYRFCTSDDVIDECGSCNYKKYAEENGVRYNHVTMLKGG